MPRNEVVERMAKKIQAIGGEYGEIPLWTELSEDEKNEWRADALELLGIVEENCETQNFPTLDGVDVFIVANDELRDAFQLARKAREGRQKNGG